MPGAGVRLIRMSRSPAGLDENDTGIATSMAVRMILAPRRTPLQHERGPSSRVFQSERGGPMTLAAHSMPGTIVCR